MGHIATLGRAAIVLTACAEILASPLQAGIPAKPNVVIILMDDMGYADIGPFGAVRQKTPELDRMAREGMKLTSFYAAPVCSASRAQLMTGCYSSRVSVPDVFFPAQAKGLNPSEMTIAEHLKNLGYATACIGKWHLGDQPEFLATRQGFDHYFGVPYSNDMQTPVPGKSQAAKRRVIPLLREENVIELLAEEDQSRLVERYTEEVVGFIRQNKDHPFFLYLPHNAVHLPIHPGKAFAGKSANGRYGDWVEEADWSTGRILQELRELKIDSRTLVIFTSDNGPALGKKEGGGSAYPLSGGKHTTLEGGMRVPTIAWWPGVIPSGSVCDAVAGTIDLMPTCVTLAGGQVPAEPVIDGRDMTALLLGKSQQSPREAHYYFTRYTLDAVRQGPWKLVFKAKAAPSLYNLEADIGEKEDVAARNPDVVQRLLALAQKMNREIGGPHPKARRPAGLAKNPKLLTGNYGGTP